MIAGAIASLAERIAAWTVRRSPPERTEWARAMQAELGVIDVPLRKLRWAASGTVLAMTPRPAAQRDQPALPTARTIMDSASTSPNRPWLTPLGRNLIAGAVFYFSVGAAVSIARGVNDGWASTSLAITLGCVVAAATALAVRARLAWYILAGQAVFGAVELAFHLGAGIEKVQGAPAHFTVMAAATFGMIAGALTAAPSLSSAVGAIWDPRDLGATLRRALLRSRRRSALLGYSLAIGLAFAIAEFAVTGGFALIGARLLDSVTHFAALSAAAIGVLVGASAEAAGRRLAGWQIARIVSALALAVLIPSFGRAQGQYTVDPKPILDLKGVDDAGKVGFGTASWATRLRNGTVVIADASGPAVHFIDANGKLIRSAGRSGQGPGDFRTVTWVGQCGEGGVYAWDFAQTRITTYDESGNVSKTLTFGARGSPQTATACNAKGMLFAFTAARRLPPPTPPDPNAQYFITGMMATPMVVATAGDTVTKLGEAPFGEILGGMINGRAGGMPRPLGATTAFALGADRVFIGVADSGSVAVYGLDGRRMGTIPVGATTRVPTPEQYAAAVEVPVAIYPAQMREAARKFALGAPLPARLPPFTSLFADQSGLLWVNLSVPGDRETLLRAFAPDGRLAGNVRIPMNLNVFEIGTDYILGAYTDADDEQHLILYRLHRGRTPG